MKRPNEPDALTDDAVDLLIDLAARAAYERMDPMDPQHAPFLAWLAREARLRLTGAERRELDRQADVFARRLRARIDVERAGNRHRVRCVNESPRSYPATDAAAAPPAVQGAVAPWWDLSVAAGVGRELWDEPPGAFVPLPHDVGDGRYVALGVAGDSMTPLLHTGDTILVKVGGELVQDQIVVARHPECGYVVKRVSRVNAMRVELASFNAAYPTLEIPNDAALVLGTVVLRWCPHA